MSLSRLAFLAVAASLLGSAATADPAQPPQGGMMSGGHGMMHGMFTPEERMMWFADSMKANAGMSDDQRHAYRQQQRDRMMGLSDADRDKLKADLDKRWAALTPQQQADIKTRIDAFRAQHMGHGDGGGNGGQ